MEIEHEHRDAGDVYRIKGRIDGLTAPLLGRRLDQEAFEGIRKIILDLSQVSYLSSAGLRVILQGHKNLKKIGGELILVAVPAIVSGVLEVSGMANFLSIFPDVSAIPLTIAPLHGDAGISQVTVGGMKFEMLTSKAGRGTAFLMGEPARLATASFQARDVVSKRLEGVTFGAGLAVMGENFKEYSTLFGESVVIDHNFFSYPAMSRPVIDYSYYAAESGQTLNFLYGFGFNGEYSNVIRFDNTDGPRSISDLVQAAGMIADSELFGFVMLATSAGIMGMHLKKSPIGQSLQQPATIYDQDLFPKWINFPIEPEEVNQVIVACGIATRNPLPADSVLAPFIPAGSGMHVHAVVFENGLWSNNIRDFSGELKRIIHETVPMKVLHLLPDSEFKNGYFGIVNLDLA